MGKSSRIRNFDKRFNRRPREPDIERSCLSKTTHHNKFDAQKAANYISQQSGEPIDYYYCNNCGFYHVGHKRG